MTATPIAILRKAAGLGLALSFEPPDTLDVKALNPWPKSFADTLRDHKSQLLALLRFPFAMVYSEVLEETIFFCEDEAIKASLVEAGADPWSIYTRDELQVLVAQNRLKPLTQAELRKIREIKRTFGAKIAE